MWVVGVVALGIVQKASANPYRRQAFSIHWIICFIYLCTPGFQIFVAIVPSDKLQIYFKFLLSS